MTSELANPASGSWRAFSPPTSPDYLSRLHLSVAGIGDRSILLDPRASVGRMVIGLGGGRSQGLRVARTGEVLAPGSIVGYCDLRSGDAVEFAEVSRTIDRTFIMRLLTGPRAGERLMLANGETRIGRTSDNDVTIVDPAMSRHHAILTVDGETVMLADAGSTNGVMIGDRMITGPTPLRLRQRALVGQSWFEIMLGDRRREPEIAAPQQAAIGSSNRLELTVRERPAVGYVGDYIEFPKPPERSRRPLRRGGLDDFETTTAEFEQALQDTRDRLTDTRNAELAGRLAEAPSVSAVIESIIENVATCWQASVANGVLARVGLATRPTRTHMLIPGGGDPEFRDRLTKLAHDHELIEGVPATVRFDRDSAVVVAGPGEKATALARSLIAQLAGRYRPAELRIWAMIDRSRVESWEWLKWLPHCGGLAEDTMAQLATIEDEFQRLIDDIPSLADPSRIDVLIVDAEPADTIVEQLEKLDLPMSVLIVAADDRPTGQRLLRFGSEVSIVEIEGESASMAEPMVIGIGYETVGTEQLEQLARTLSPVVESDWLISSLPPVPRGCVDTLVEDTPRSNGTLGRVLRGNDPAIVTEQWDMSHDSTLSTIIGHDESGPVAFALDTGPHAIVAGHYECFLPAWVATLAARYSPHHFNFFLFDSQAGLVFRECRSLPHCVGVIDDVSPVSIKSALASLSAELDRREAVLASVGAESVQELEKRRRTDGYVVPRLVLIVDQLCRLGDSDFSGLQPVGELVELARRGHRLGLHLVVGVGSELVNEPDVVVLGTAPDDVRDLADLDAAIVHLPRPGVGRLRLVGGEPRRFTASVAGRRPEIVVHRYILGQVERLYRGPVQIAYHDDLARLITQVTKAYDYGGGVRPSWLL